MTISDTNRAGLFSFLKQKVNLKPSLSTGKSGGEEGELLCINYYFPFLFMRHARYSVAHVAFFAVSAAAAVNAAAHDAANAANAANAADAANVNANKNMHPANKINIEY